MKDQPTNAFDAFGVKLLYIFRLMQRNKCTFEALTHILKEMKKVPVYPQAHIFCLIKRYSCTLQNFSQEFNQISNTETFIKI
jgi:hypothetical protein